MKEEDNQNVQVRNTQSKHGYLEAFSNFSCQNKVYLVVTRLTTVALSTKIEADR